MKKSQKPKYPTKKEILKNQIKFKKNTINIILKWKKEFLPFKNTKPKLKFLRITILINQLAKLHNKKINIRYNKTIPSFMYHAPTKTIILDKTLSIISSLHEFAHHLFGKSELKACKWSVQLYKLTFPKQYKKLKWKGHTLIKNNQK